MRRFVALIPVLVILIAPPVMLWTLWLDPVSAGEDDLGYYYPLRVMVGQALREGHWPSENPLEATVAPLMADPQAAVLHPATWLFAALPAKLAYTLSIFIAFWLAGGGAYVYLRRLGLVRAAACFGATAFMFCGFFVGHRVHLGVILAAAMLPWGLWCIEGLRRGRPTGRPSAEGRLWWHGRPGHATHGQDAHATFRGPAVWPWLAPVIFLALSAGHWPTFIHISIVWAAYFMLRARPFWRSLGVWAAAGALAALAAAPQVYSTWVLLDQTTRQRIGFAMAGENSFFPAAAVLAVFPFLMGNRTPNFFAQDWWGPWHQCEMLGYVGLVTLVLAGAAVWKMYRRTQLRIADCGLRIDNPRPAIAPNIGKAAMPSGARDTGETPNPKSARHGEGRCRSRAIRNPESAAGETGAAGRDADETQARYRPLVRVWTWLGIGAGVWMLGYYLPTYWLIYKLPVLNILRCPARMVLAADLALATLAAIAIHCLCAFTGGGNATGDARDDGGSDARDNATGCPRENASAQPTGKKTENNQEDPDLVVELTEAVRRGVRRKLPLAMAATLAVLGLAAWLLGWLGIWGQSNPFFVGGPREALEALRPWNPAIWVPAATMAATAAAVGWWLRAPARRPAILVALLLADLFFLTRYVDAGSPAVAAELGTPPAAAWLKSDASADANGRVWGLSETYFHRQRELLLPKTCCLYDVATIASYGPFQSPRHAHLLGFNICGYNRDWADLLRRNRLISMYNVRYILAEAGGEFERVLQSVRVTADQAREMGPNLIGKVWDLHRVVQAGETWRLETPYLWDSSEAKTPLLLEPNTIYRISLDARGPESGAANFLRADVFHKGTDYSWSQPEAWGLTVPGEQIGANWRHFRWTFGTEANIPSPLGFRLLSMSERPIEVRGLSLRKLSQWESPEAPGGLAVGEAVYRKAAELPPARAADAPIVIYENRLARGDENASPAGRAAPEGRSAWSRPNEEEIEKVKWNLEPPPQGPSSLPDPPPDVGLTRPITPPRPIRTLALETTLPAGAAYLLVALWALRRPRRD